MNYRFCTNTLIITALLLFTPIIKAQQFPIGTFIASKDMDERHSQDAWNSVDSSGMNTFIQYADAITQGHLNGYNAIGLNNDFPQDKIYYYSIGYYSKWEAETNGSNLKTGIVHNSGLPANWKGINCWTNNTIAPAESLLYGPHYKQDKDWKDFGDRVSYIARYKLALDYDSAYVNPNTEICKLYVTERYTKIINGVWDGSVYVDTFATRTLKVSDFYLTGGNFKNFELIYQYPPSFQDKNLEKRNNVVTDIFLSDVDSDNGVEFKLNFLGGSNHIRNIYADRIEVYDNRVWRLFMENPSGISNEIKSYALSFKNSGWDNMKYWYACDEPRSIDNYLPLHIIDSLVRSVNCPPLITEIYPPWNTVVNGDTLLKKYMDIAQPHTLMIDTYPIWTPEGGTVAEGLEDLRIKLQLSHSLQPNFWYVGQGFGEQDLIDPNLWHIWRKPTASELKASVMLALAHGIKGLLFWNYWSYESYQPLCDCNILHNSLVDVNYQPTELWYLIKNNLAPRLKNNLGNILLGLNYTGNSLQYQYITPTQNSLPQPPSYGYLTIGLQSTNNDMNWHVGFFNKPDQIDNKYFLMSNLWTNSSKSIQVKVTPPVDAQGYTNYRFRNIEPENNFDITFQNQATQTLTFPAGEGYLFQVAPVVKYGGKLVYNETTTNGTTLFDKMSIESSATLTINGRYYANADITVKAGGKLKYGDDNSKIIFSNGAKLILDGNALVYGTSSSNKLNLQYDASTSIGVVVNPGASPIISYCNITGPSNGISVENEATINISNTSISNCSNTGIALFHFGNGESSSTLSTPNIYKCSITNCGTAISTVNCSEVIIKENTITQCNLGLYFNMVNSAYISSNTILGWQSATGSPMPGISMSSSGGYLRNNTIRYHNYGVLLAYASPDLGVNTIEYNYICGVYSSLGSYPNLVQQLANPECWYPIGGCNVIKNNGTFPHLPPSSPSTQPDGAEIFLNSGDVLLSYGFNEISDDRTGIPTYLTLPLIKGTRSTGGSREFFVDHNYYGTVGPSRTRFGTLEADYDPTAEYCPLPDAPCSGSEIIIQTTDGQIIDTLDSRERETTEITALEENYANADKLFYSGEIEEAKTYYLTIVQGYYTNAEKLYAYNKLYEIGALLKEEDAYFTELQNAFNSILEVETDTLLLKAFNQRAILCDVSKEEYVTAINKFDTIIQQNPNSEEAVYAEIDIITTALKMDTTNSGLGKIGGGKYLVKGTTDYLSKLNNILQSKFAINDEDKEQIIPKEYSLHQNYPNPFNPTTTIKFDLPKDGLVQLEIFDILGRRITTLVNEYKNAGSYEHQFDASSLASGVYVYKLQSGDFISSKKMILLK